MNTPTMSLFRLRDMDNVHLVNFFQLTLKSKNDFDAAFDLVLSTKLSEYLKLFLIPQPDDGLLSSTPDRSFTKPFRHLAAHLMSLIILKCALQIVHMQESALLNLYNNK